MSLSLGAKVSERKNFATPKYNQFLSRFSLQFLEIQFNNIYWKKKFQFQLIIPGDGWGMQGYALIARNRNNSACGLAKYAMYPCW